MKSFNSAHILVASALILFAIAARWLPHPPNFTPVVAVALFSGMAFKNRFWGFLIPLAGLLISDSLLGFYDGMWANYFCYFLVALVGFGLHKFGFRLRSWGLGSFAAAVVFFVSSNFFVWALGFLYPRTAEGLWACYGAALPFFQNTLASTFLYAGALWGLFRLAEPLTRATYGGGQKVS